MDRKIYSKKWRVEYYYEINYSTKGADLLLISGLITSAALMASTNQIKPFLTWPLLALRNKRGRK